MPLRLVVSVSGVVLVFFCVGHPYVLDSKPQILKTSIIWSSQSTPESISESSAEIASEVTPGPIPKSFAESTSGTISASPTDALLGCLVGVISCLGRPVTIVDIVAQHG